MIIVGSLIVIVLLFSADLVLISRALRSPTICPALGEELGAPTFQGWEGGPFGSNVLLSRHLVVTSKTKGQRGWWASPSSPDLDVLRSVSTIEVETATAVGKRIVAAHVFRTQFHTAINAFRHGGVPAPPRVAPRLYPLFYVYVVDTHHPQDREGRPRPGSGFCRSRLPWSAGAPRPFDPENEGPEHTPSTPGRGEGLTPR
jgi:hypothetical protein